MRNTQTQNTTQTTTPTPAGRDAAQEALRIIAAAIYRDLAKSDGNTD